MSSKVFQDFPLWLAASWACCILTIHQLQGSPEISGSVSFPQPLRLEILGDQHLTAHLCDGKTTFHHNACRHSKHLRRSLGRRPTVTRSPPGHHTVERPTVHRSEPVPFRSDSGVPETGEAVETGDLRPGDLRPETPFLGHGLWTEGRLYPEPGRWKGDMGEDDCSWRHGWWRRRKAA